MDVADIVERSQWDFFWVPEDASVVDRPEVLYVRCPRDWPLLNCVTRTRAPASRLESIVGEVGAAHRGLTSRWLVRDMPGHFELAKVLSSAGYAPAFRHGAYAMRLDALSRQRSPDLEVRRVETAAQLKDWYDVADAVFGDPVSHPPHELDRFLDECTRPGARVHRFVAYDGPRPVSCGGMTSFPWLRFGYLWAGATVATDRGRGAYRAVLHARLAHAQRLGLDTVGLYARVDTSAPIVQRAGFERHGSMSYWDRPAR